MQFLILEMDSLNSPPNAYVAKNSCAYNAHMDGT
jgi:hypothetical protein